MRIVTKNLLVFFLLCLSAASASAFDLKKPPTPTDVESLAKQGWATSAEELSAALAAAYAPGKNGRPGSSGDPAFAPWIDLWSACELLSRSSDAQTTALVQRHFFKERGTGKLFFLAPGQMPPATLDTIPKEEAAAMAAHPQIRDQLLKAALPRGAEIPAGSLGDIAGPALAKNLLSDSSLLCAFLSTLSEKDHAPLVLQNLRAIREAHPGKWREYGHLAIALAVVNDSALPENWPHIQVTPSLVPKEIPPVAEQFARWVSANEAGHLKLDPRKLSPGQLKFVVDAFVPDSELEWARKNIRLTRSNFDRAFSEVAYRPERIKTRRFFWDTSPYTLEAIRRDGGICVDQAYYAIIAGKAHGLPTLFFTGQGKDGGHAWFGYMKRDDKWELDIGRYSNQNYAIGRALDPQTWQPISDHELQLLAAHFRDKPEFAASMNDLAMASIFEKAGSPDRADAAYASAIQTCPQNPEAWERRGDFLARINAPPEERKKLHEEAVRRLGSSPDLKVRHQTALADLHREGGDQSSAKKVEQTIIAQNRRNRSDLGVSVAAQKVNSAIESDDLDAAAAEFHRQLYALDKNSGGDFLKQVGLPFIQALMKNGKNVRARRAIGTMRQQLSPDPGSLLDMALKDLEQSTR
jgi:hypothetical protein